MQVDAPLPSSDLCPTFDQLQAFGQGRLEPAVVESISQHLQSCSRCALLLLSLSEAASSAQDPGGEGNTAVSGDGANQPGAVPAGVSVPTASFAPVPDHIDRYAILRVLGRGGFGTVYLARDQQLDRLVAVKTPHPERIQRPSDRALYVKEAELHAGVDHPHVVPIYDVCDTDDAPFFLVSKFVPGIDLAQRIRGQRPDARTTARWIAILAEALQHIHGQGLIHRDVKPRNIMIDAAGQPHLMDFGLAKQPSIDGSAGPIAGTPAYMAPEQARGGKLDGRCDVYSLGVVLYELLTGKRPFHGRRTALLNQVLSVMPMLPRFRNRGVPRDLEAICVKALAKDPADRYQTAADMAADLRRWLAGEPPVLARRVGAAERIWLWLRRHRTAAALVGLAVAAAVLAGFAFVHRPQPEPTVQATVHTEPPGAMVHYFPMDPKTGLVRGDQGKREVAGNVAALTPGHYLVVAVLGDRFHEVFRYVPTNANEWVERSMYRHQHFVEEDGVIRLNRIALPSDDPAANMTLVPGIAEFRVGRLVEDVPSNFARVPSFYLDTKEVTVKEFEKWGKPFRGEPPEPLLPDFPMTFVNWDEAVAFAEQQGKRLPDEFEYEYAATELGKRPPLMKDRLASWTRTVSGQPAWDEIKVPGQLSIFGLRSNVAEWTGSWRTPVPGVPATERLDPMLRVVRGGNQSVLEGAPDKAMTELWQPEDSVSQSRPVELRGLGFRCARSAKARTKAEDFIAVWSR